MSYETSIEDTEEPGKQMHQTRIRSHHIQLGKRSKIWLIKNKRWGEQTSLFKRGFGIKQKHLSRKQRLYNIMKLIRGT